jgi:putative membrane protein, TIGR04086 family/integral membrane protein, TIGR04097 family
MDFKLFKGAVIAVGIAYLAAAALLLALGAAAYNLEDPDKYLTVFAIAALAVSAASCGVAASKLYTDNTFSCGLTAGLIFAAVLFIVSAIMPGEGFGFALNTVFALAAAGISALVAHLCRPRAPSSSQIRRRAKRARAR